MRNKPGKRNIIAAVAAVVALFALLGLTLHFIESRGIVSGQLGDTGEWGDEDDFTYFTLDGEDYLSRDRLETYLICGTDSGGEDEGEGYNGELADFITLLVIDNTTQKYAFYEIDRNSMCDVSIINKDGDFVDDAKQQICTAHWYGRTPEERNDNLINAAIGLFGGMDLEKYYVMSMEDIDKVNDAIGGVTVTIDEDMTKVDKAFVKGADVRLSNGQAEKYLRARSGVGKGTNAERMSRQEQYMQNAFSMIYDQLRENPDYINDLYSGMKDLFETNGNGKDLSRVANSIVTYENAGFIKFDGKTKINDTIGEGIEHEEFYVDEGSMLNGLSKVINIEKDTVSDDDEEEDAEDGE